MNIFVYARREITRFEEGRVIMRKEEGERKMKKKKKEKKRIRSLFFPGVE